MLPTLSRRDALWVRPAIRSLVLSALLATLLSCDGATAGQYAPTDVDLATETVATGLDTVWELAWGPDGMIWFTERTGRISRLDPATGAVTPVGQVPEVREFGEGGLMGLAFHPDFATEPWVYVSHTYGASPRNRVVRMRYESGTLGAPQVLLDDIPGSAIHNGSRLVVGPDRYLYVTTGDASDGSLAQYRESLGGKVLRLTLDGQPAPGNPFGTPVFSFGHRNPQGIAFASDGTLYITEHGPSDNDEVNIVEAGRNYGWPVVHGFCDGDAGLSEQSFCLANDVVEPIAAWTPTIAPAGLVWYDAALIPEFSHSLIFATLNGKSLYRIALSSDGRTVQSIETLIARDFGRLRAVLVAPDGAIWLGTSNRDGRGSPSAADDRIIRIRPR